VLWFTIIIGLEEKKSLINLVLNVQIWQVIMARVATTKSFVSKGTP
jgi:hypothetical protein